MPKVSTDESRIARRKRAKHLPMLSGLDPDFISCPKGGASSEKKYFTAGRGLTASPVPKVAKCHGKKNNNLQKQKNYGKI
jgi:hypothetical protein